MTFSWLALFMLAVMYFPVALAHELGHWSAAWLLGLRDVQIRFGNPKRPAVHVPLGRLRLTLHLGLDFWFHIPVTLVGRLPGPGANLFFSLGGPLVSAVLCLLLKSNAGRMWAEAAAAMRHGGFVLPFHSPADALTWWAYWLVLWPLVPCRYANGLYSDGAQILLSLRELARRRSL